jgi:hypothetical protein
VFPFVGPAFEAAINPARKANIKIYLSADPVEFMVH